MRLLIYLCAYIEQSKSKAEESNYLQDKEKVQASKGNVICYIKELKDRSDLGITSGNSVADYYQYHNIIYERFGGNVKEPRIKIPER